MKNNIFNFRRFGQYFVYDLNNAKNNYWLSLLITGLIPVISYVLSELLSKLFTGAWFSGSLATQISSVAAALIVVTMSFPAKAYGSITERRAGSSWLMVPASPFEKWLSMILICCVVLPVCLFVLLFGSDALMSLVIPSYSKPLLYYIWNVNEFIAEGMGDGAISVNVLGIAFVSWASSILPFLLGAIFFKKSKVAKTFLALMGLSIVLSSAAFPFMKGLVLDMGEFLDRSSEFLTAKAFFNRFNILVNLDALLTLGTLLALTFARVRTIKH